MKELDLVQMAAQSGVQEKTQKSACADSDTMPLKVMHVISGLGQGGAETVMFRLLTATRYEVAHEVVTLGGMAESGPKLQAEGIPVQAFGLSGRNVLTQGRAPFLRALERIQPDVIQTWMYHSNALASWWAYRAGYKGRIVWNIRNSGKHLEDFSLISRLSLRAGAWLSRRLPTAIVSCAQSAAEQHRRLGFRGPPMTVIPNGIDTVYWQPDATQGQEQRSKMRIRPDMPVLGVVARWHPLKDYPNLLRALGQVVQKYPNVKCLLIGGEVVQTNKELMRLIKEHQLENNVLLLGQRDDVAEWMRAMDIFVLSSKAEGFPNVVCEAMASGVRCVVTDVGDAALIVGNEGVVVAPEDANALAVGIEQAIYELSADVHRQAIETGRKRMQAEFGADQMNAAYVRLWREVANQADSKG